LAGRHVERLAFTRVERSVVVAAHQSLVADEERRQARGFRGGAGAAVVQSSDRDRKWTRRHEVTAIIGEQTGVRERTGHLRVLESITPADERARGGIDRRGI